MQAYQKDSDYEANKFTLKAIRFSCILFGIIWILNILGIFIVDDTIMNVGFFGSILICAITFAVVKSIGLSNPKTKYVVLLFSAINYDFIGVMLTYHALLITALPLLLSVQYRNNKIIRYAYLITAIGHIVNVYGGYYLGLCNANMLLFTAHPTEFYAEQITEGILAPNDPGMPIPLALLVFFVVPQWFILMAFLPVLFHISKQVEIRTQNEIMGKRQSETDFMTGLGNSAHYQQMLKDYYPVIKNLAIIIWDINNMRLINEQQGHEVGDTLIAMAADSIKPLEAPNQKLYRVAGDEFVLIIENPSDGAINKALLKWNSKLDELNRSSITKLSAMVGYSQGSGRDIDFLVKDAYRMMANLKDTARMKAIPR